MQRWRRLVPVILMGSFAVAYVLARPGLLGVVPHLAILEFPIGAAVVAFLMWAALGRHETRAPPAPWRRHAQVVRELPDPAMMTDLLALDRYVESGADVERAADVIARARTNDPREQDSVRARAAEALAGRMSRRKRESLLKETLDGA